MKEYTATANKITGLLWAYSVGYLEDKELYEDLQSLMNYDSFCIEQQKRVDSGLPPTVVTQQLIQAMRDFLKEDYTRFSGMDLEKGLVNELDRLHLSIESWVNSFEDYYKSPIEIIYESQQEEPEETHPEPIPPELQTERAVKYFSKAVEMGFLEQTETGYKSKFNSKALLAYFLELVFCRDDEGKDNGVAFPETALNRLFNETRLGKARGQYINNNKGKPIGYEKVESIFK